ncbi:MAG: helix-turn-helix transcriptional regulator [Clostridia bacterium]|nr:helix-turn-helix transcriptional regulator [Clostridia bacterium]
MNRIKELRLERGMTQKDLAARLGVVRTTLSNYENEVNQLDPETIRRICLIFDCTADYLIGMSARRSAQISDEDAALVAAYHAADDDARAIVDLALKPYFAETKIPAAAG